MPSHGANARTAIYQNDPEGQWNDQGDHVFTLTSPHSLVAD